MLVHFRKRLLPPVQIGVLRLPAAELIRKLAQLTVRLFYSKRVDLFLVQKSEQRHNQRQSDP
ncbi:hypothetical protein D3C85_1523370 [compost metagenome]